MPNAEIDKAEAGATGTVTHEPTVRLWKGEASILAAPQDVPALQADGWLDFEPSLPDLAAEFQQWIKAADEAAAKFVEGCVSDGYINTTDQAQLYALQTAVREVGTVFNRLQTAAFGLYPVSEEGGPPAPPEGPTAVPTEEGGEG